MKRRHKFNARPTTVDGRRYDSKREARFAAELRNRKLAGEVVGWLEQVPLHLPGGVIYRLDFLIFEANDTVRAVEVKGRETQAWKIKKRLVDEAYPWLPLEVVR